MPELVQKQGHIAYTVPSLEEELKGKKVIFGPAVCDEHLTIAFIEEEGIIRIERKNKTFYIFHSYFFCHRVSTI